MPELAVPVQGRLRVVGARVVGDTDWVLSIRLSALPRSETRVPAKEGRYGWLGKIQSSSNMIGSSQITPCIRAARAFVRGSREWPHWMG